MAKLTLKEFRCVVDTDEMGDESPYFVTWVGDLKIHECQTKRTRKDFWENKVSPGPWWPANHVVLNDGDFDLSPSHTLALAVMIEEDEGTDLTITEAETLVNNKMKPVLLNHIQAGFTANDPNFISTMRNTLRDAIKTHLATSVGADDDLMEESGWKAARRIVLTSGPGPLDVVTFKGGNGEYQARYRKD